MCCLERRAESVHEIERRSHAPWRWADVCNYLFVCEECHQGELATMPHARQLAIKQMEDEENYNLKDWLRVRDPDLKAPERVTQEEVNEFCRLIIEEAENANS